MRKLFIIILALVLFTSGCALLPTANQGTGRLEELQLDYERLEEKYESLLVTLDSQEKNLLKDKETIKALEEEIKILQEQPDNDDLIEELLETIAELQDEIDYLRANPPVCENTLLTQADIEDLLFMSKAEILDFFGDNYVFDYITDGISGYIYDSYALIFDDNNHVEVIICDMVEIEGYEISLGLTFDDIQEYLGYTDIYEIEQVTPNDPSYVLVYNYNDYYLWLGSDEVDGMITHIQIRYF